MNLTRSIVVGSLLVMMSPLAGQTFGEITGTVTDPTGAVVVRATVTVTNTGTNQAREVSTNEAGNYTVPFLVPGIYSVTARGSGFKLSTRSRVELQVGDVARVDFAMELGGVTETVEVRAGAPLLTTENATVGTVIENKRIVELPLNGRNYLQMIALSSNVTAEQQAGGEAADRKGGERANQAFSIAGQRIIFNHYTLDGIENTDVSYNLFAIRPSIDALQEFKVETGIYSSEYGRATSQITVTTKPGTNEFHGTLFEFHRNQHLDAREWLKEGPKNPFLRNQFGFTLGARLIRNKLFSMSNFETLKERKTLQQTASVATERMRAGDFSASGRAIYDPLSRVFASDPQGNLQALSAARFPNDTIPASRLHPIAKKLLEFYPQARVPGDNIFRNFVRDASRPVSWEQFTERLDFVESSSSTWFGRFSWGDEYLKQLATFEEQAGKTVTKTYQSMISNTRSLRPTMFNEFRFGYTQFQNDNLFRYAYERDITKELGIVGLAPPVQAAWGTPSIGLGLGLTSFGEPVNGPFVERSHIFQALDNLSVVKGGHSLKFGGEIRRNRFNEVGNAFPRGSFGFDAKATFDPANRANTGHPFADMMLGEVRTATRVVGLSSGMLRSTAFALYIQDTWKVTPKLTVDLGLRYENTPPFHDKYRGIINAWVFDPGVGPQGLLDRSQTKVPVLVRPGLGDFYQGLDFRFHDPVPVAAGDQFLGRAMVHGDNNDFGPRLGIAWHPTERWTLRTGGGLFYSQDIAEVRFDLARNLGGRSDFISSEEKPNSNLGDPWAFERSAYRCTGWAGICQGPTSILSNNTNRRTPYVLQWLFDIQRQLDQNTVLEVGYMGNGGHKLERWRNWNQPVTRTGPNDFRSLQERRPWPAYGIIFNADGVVDSNYNALSVKLRRNFAHGLTYLMGYTWSKSIDTGSAIRNHNGDSLFPPNSYDIRSWRGLSQFHTGRRLVTSVLYELPFGLGKPVHTRWAFGDKLIGGWQVGSILTFADGTPWQVGGIGDRNDTQFGNYPDATGISPIPTSRSANNFWNLAAFDTTNPELSIRFGNAGRDTLLTPGLRQWDFSMIKNTAVMERHSLQFRFEAFNFSNHPNWNPPSSDPLGRATFGRVTSARTMRELQFGLKYVF
jgi:hypothetical protein